MQIKEKLELFLQKHLNKELVGSFLKSHSNYDLYEFLFDPFVEGDIHSINDIYSLSIWSFEMGEVTYELLRYHDNSDEPDTIDSFQTTVPYNVLSINHLF